MDSSHLVPDQQPPAVPVAELLSRMRLELAQLALSADGLQGLLGGLAIHLHGEERDRFMIGAQDLDLLVQRIEGLAAFLRALAPLVPAEWTLDPARALAGLGLSEQARALAGQQAAAAAVSENAGDVVVF